MAMPSTGSNTSLTNSTTAADSGVRIKALALVNNVHDRISEDDMVQATQSRHVERHPFVKGVHGVRYQVKDIGRSVAFYTQHLGFKLEHQQLPAFANVSLGDAQILLSGPGASGSRPMPDGQQQEPGGWNRVVLKVAALSDFVAELKEAGIRLRNEMETGPGGRQIQIEDPDGNPIELFEPAH